MAFWDFVKDAGKSVFGSAEAAEAKTPEQADTERKVKALEAEVKALGLDSGDVHLTLRGDTVKVESKGADRETMEKLIVAIGNIKGIARVEADVPKAPGRASTSGSDAPAADAPVFHTVKKGDNLWKIAETHYGKGKGPKHTVIFEANKPMLTHPDKIYPGQVLRIPELAD